MENIPYTMVIHKHVDGVDTRFSTMSVPSVNNPLVKCLGLIITGTYQAAYEDSRWAYELVSYLWPYGDPGSYSIDDGSISEERKYL